MLLEQAAEGADRIIGILLLLLRRRLRLRAAAEATQFRLQHGGSDTAHIGDELGILSRSFDLKGDGRSGVSRGVLAATKNPADRATDSAARSAGPTGAG